MQKQVGFYSELKLFATWNEMNLIKGRQLQLLKKLG